ncbi:MAG: MCP four helix bundle domain-containing protein [Deltaproteobacteria bacterium]|nr:MCP four helix bundle domain-containing protein [Deltaproteobacteria bacterium]
MWTRINLRTRIYTILIALILITLAGGLVMVWYTYRMQSLLTHIIEKNVVALRAAEELEIALVNQKGFVSYYFLDADPEWLERLGEYRQIFKERLREARLNVETQDEKRAIDRIESEYVRYITSKDQVITHYKAGSRKIGSSFHQEVRNHFFKILELTEDFKKMKMDQIRAVTNKSHAQARQLRIIAGSAIITVFFLGALFVFVLTNQVLGPVRRLALKADREGGTYKAGNEVKALSRGVRGLIEDIDHSHSELEKKHEILLQAEKMALVGKLAAGTAHSIRNPLTSVKMRLFSLARSLDLNANQNEDFAVISEEIAYIDTIVENFLEFSRPPKLKMQKVNPSNIVDISLKLLQHRIEACDVSIRLNRKKFIPDIQADPKQFKEVLVNLIVNACESMQGGGLLVISEEETFKESLGRSVEIRITDTGSGIPESIQEEIFQPFFTTKEEGTGLGLSIAAQIIKQHGGSLAYTPTEGRGATFIISVPVNPVK